MKKEFISTISQKGQTTIPVRIRKLLNVGPGDMIKYKAEEDGIRIKKIDSIDLKWAIAIEKTLTEWSGTEDDDL